MIRHYVLLNGGEPGVNNSYAGPRLLYAVLHLDETLGDARYRLETTMLGLTEKSIADAGKSPDQRVYEFEDHPDKSYDGDDAGKNEDGVLNGKSI